MNIVITGCTSGIGAETVKGLSDKCDRLFLLVRNQKKAESLLADLPADLPKDRFEVVFCDLEDLKSVAAAADYVREKVTSLDLLINNAGGIFPKGTITRDGFETTFQVNHLGHFLLTQKLLPLLLKTPTPRIINVSSEAHRAANPKLNEVTNAANYSSFPAYANAKLYNILFSKSLQEKYGSQGLGTFSLHPGVVKTNFGGDFTGVFKLLIKLSQPFMITAKAGAQTTLFLATSAIKKEWNGAYFKKSKPVTPSKLANSKKLREDLWEKSANWVADLS
ncbi:MAG: SDR family NAD(P)-dependent oxidoreductase [Lunatimonas sp.]|uniref:SDR family NAD(P)-dependent oxidoreductase n=1 Tax=Lunatimonas sp. TaxID=2060141 RepID=UPI00263BDC9E|nr:SDR family NAD(P)-dependent oxidoreductase [Lunatimonas sp.]MCC5937964.1 SDR family NAD(P)-dependent oxidoreductase [Lunatimonas sp.]